MRLALALLLLCVTPARAQVAVTFHTYRFAHDSTGAGVGEAFDDRAAALYAEEFAAAGRPAPTRASATDALPQGTRLFDAFVAAEDGFFGYAELHEATPGQTSPDGYRTWSRLYQSPPFIQPTGSDLEELVRLTAREVLARMGWTPAEPGPLPEDSFYVYGPSPSRTGTLRAHLPEGWRVQWFDAVGRVVSTEAEARDLPSGPYFAVGTVVSTRERQSRRALVVR